MKLPGADVSRLAARLLALAMITVLMAVACGEGVITFGGRPDDDDDNDTITVSGNIDDVHQPNDVIDTVVFVYSNLDPTDLAEGPPFNADGSADSETALVASDDTFSLADVGSGDLTVIFLRDGLEPDGSVVDPDGKIDPGDTCAVLIDVDNRLRDVKAGRQIDLRGIDIAFDSPATRCSESRGELPAEGCGCALPGDISVSAPQG